MFRMCKYAAYGGSSCIRRRQRFHRALRKAALDAVRPGWLAYLGAKSSVGAFLSSPYRVWKAREMTAVGLLDYAGKYV